MKLICWYLSFIICITYINAAGQTFYIYGDKTFGGDNADRFGNAIGGDNFQMILAGETRTNINGDKTVPLCDSLVTNVDDLWVLKIDTAFNIIWQKNIGGNLDESGTVVRSGNAGSRIIIVCDSQSDSSCDKSEGRILDSLELDYWIYVTDTGGNYIFDRTLGSSSRDNEPQAIMLESGNYIVSGLSDPVTDGVKTAVNYGLIDYWIVKLDGAGNILWDNVYGGTNSELYDHDLYTDSNDNILLFGTVNSPISGNISDSARGGWDFWLAKIDSSGQVIWDKRYGGSGNDYAKRIIATNDGGYALFGHTRSPLSGEVSEQPKGMPDFWIIKTDSLGNKQWDKRFGGSGLQEAAWIEQDYDGGYLLAGSTTSDSSFDITENSYGNRDYWIIKIDSSGNKLWDKRFGGTGSDYLMSFVLFPDTSIMLYGYSPPGISPVKTDSGKGSLDYWLVHFKFMDNIIGLYETQKENSILLFPNPSSGIVEIPESLVDSELTVYDITGRKAYDCEKIRSTEMNFEDLQSGYYVFRFKAASKYYYSRWIKN